MVKVAVPPAPWRTPTSRARRPTSPGFRVRFRRPVPAGTSGASVLNHARQPLKAKIKRKVNLKVH